MKAVINFCAVMTAGLLLSACVNSHATITSQKLDGGATETKKILVFAEFGDELKLRKDAGKVFSTKFSESLAGCGIGVEQHINEIPIEERIKRPLSLDDDVQEKKKLEVDRAEFIKKFGPQSVLDIEIRSTTKSTRGLDMVTYIASLYDIKTQKYVWKADIKFIPAWYAGENLAASLIQNLKDSGLIASNCMPPVVPKA